jgi:hypothetical protein
MKYIDLIEQAGVQIQSGAFYGGEDFGEQAWIVDWADSLTAIVTVEGKDVCYVECLDESEDTYYYYMPEKFSNLSISEATSVRVDDIESVFDVWMKNKEKYSDESYDGEL